MLVLKDALEAIPVADLNDAGITVVFSVMQRTGKRSAQCYNYVASDLESLANMFHNMAQSDKTLSQALFLALEREFTEALHRLLQQQNDNDEDD